MTVRAQSHKLNPGEYLRHCRVRKAGLSLPTVAAQLLRLPEAIRYPDDQAISEMAQRLAEAEADHAPFTPQQAQLVARVLPIDPLLYALLRQITGPSVHRAASASTAAAREARA